MKSNPDNQKQDPYVPVTEEDGPQNPWGNHLFLRHK
jgi:hypothetical protein